MQNAKQTLDPDSLREQNKRKRRAADQDVKGDGRDVDKPIDSINRQGCCNF
jgi:hypothetical protein